MLCCFNPTCQSIENPEENRYCIACGSPLLLKERYRAIALIGSGGFGRTFRGYDYRDPSQDPQPCAIKQLYIPFVGGSSREKILELFERESRWLYQLDEHPQTPRFIDYFSEGDHFYLIQELVIGATLTKEIASRETPYTEAEIVDFLQEAIAILKYIHQYKIIHRDLKPDNLIRRERDQKWVLIDFGASRILSETAMRGGATVIGTPEYMAPEQNRGQAFPASDLYSLGVIAVQMVTGRSTLDMFDLHSNCWFWTKFIPPETTLSKAFVSLLNDMVAPTLGDRLKTALQVEQRLKRIDRRQQVGNLELFQPQQTVLQRQANYINPAQQPTVPFETPAPLLPNNPPTPPDQPPENSPPAIDLGQLENYLRWHRWKAADQETWQAIATAIGKENSLFLFAQDLREIPCEVLWDIDQLWRKYSKDRFGFSKQLEIYRAVDGEYHQFCHELGWSITPKSHAIEKEFQFKTQAPVGHLPSRQRMGGSALWKNAQVLYGRIAECQSFR